jgi:hypothetical protein
MVVAILARLGVGARGARDRGTHRTLPGGGFCAYLGGRVSRAKNVVATLLGSRLGPDVQSAGLPEHGTGEWSRHSDLNRGPAVYETAALPLSYVGPRAESIGPAQGHQLFALTRTRSTSCSKPWHNARTAANRRDPKPRSSQPSERSFDTGHGRVRWVTSRDWMPPASGYFAVCHRSTP